MRKRITPGVILGVVAVVLGLTGSAAAGSLITSAKIKDGTVQGRDIKKGTITLSKLAPSVQKALAKAGTPGLAGATGATGAKGDTGPAVQGSPPFLQTAGNWGIVNRNTIGSPQIGLRSGPGAPPLGKGALNFVVAEGEKAAFGNEVDTYAGGLVDNLTAVGFRVYTTGENIESGHGGANMPSITFEIDPNLAGSPTKNYASLVFMPDNSTANQWSPYIDATTTGHWGLTGFGGTDCDINGPRCSFTEIKHFLDDGGEPAKIISTAVTKGRDFAFQGAVDGLRINDTVLDFEEDGVVTTTP